MIQHRTRKSLARPTGAFVILAMSASLFLAAVSVSSPSGTTTRVVRDPENPAYAGNTIVSADSGARTVHDPENPYWAGSTISAASSTGGSTAGLK